MATIIHPTAVVKPGAVIGDDCTIGPFCNIGPKVILGNRVNLVSNVTINGKTSIGDDSVVYPFAVLGQSRIFSKKSLSIGKRCKIREWVKIVDGTSIGDDCSIMYSSFIGHDCKIGNNVVMSNLVRVLGHVEIEDYAILSSGVTVLPQFLRIGRNAFVCAMSYVCDGDIVPYAIYDGMNSYALFVTLNIIGLERHEFTYEDRHAIYKVYSSVFGYDVDNNLLIDKLNKVSEEVKGNKHAMYAIDFIKNSYKRGKLKTEKRPSRVRYTPGISMVNCASLKNDGVPTVDDLKSLYEVFHSVYRIDKSYGINLNDICDEVKNNKYVMNIIDFIENRSKRGK